MKKLLIILLLGSAAVSPSQDLRGTIAGTVTDAQTRQPLVGANVVLRGMLVGAATDRNGRFRVRPVLPGRYAVTVSMIGYRTQVHDSVNVVAGQETMLNPALESVPIETEPVIVTASRREQSLNEVPVSVSTVTSLTLAERNVVTLDDALRYVPGVNLMQDQVNIRGSSGYSRGVGSRVLLLLDGMPFLTGDTGEINWETIPTGQVERIEVVKGAGSSLYGSSALGGVINVITKDVTEATEVRVRAFSGLYGKPRYPEWVWSDKARFNSGVTVELGSSLDQLGYRVSVARLVDDSYRENDAYHRWNIMAKAKYTLDESRSLSALFNLLDRRHGNFFWWKNLRRATIPADDQRNGNATSRRGNVSLSFKEFLNEKLFYTVKGMYFGNFWKDDSSGRVNNVSSSHVTQGEIQLTNELGSGNVLTLGVSGNYDRVESNLFGNHPGVGLAAYVQDELEPLTSLKVTAGLRLDIQKASALPRVSKLSPKLGMVYLMWEGTTVRASAGTGFRYPSIGELFISSSTNVSQIVVLPNQALKAEESASVEVGLSHSFGDEISVDAAVFRNDFRNLIEPGVKLKKIRPTDSLAQAVIEFDNVTRARIQGFEIGIKAGWWGGLVATDIGYTSIYPRDRTEHAALKFRPRHLLHTSIAVAYDEIRLSADYRFISRVERIDDNLVRAAEIIHGAYRVPIHVADVRIQYVLSGFGFPLRVGFNVTNVMNYHYVELIGNLAPGRMYTLVAEAGL